MQIGIMQGRLLPPVEGRIQAFPARDWAKEFALAAAAGLDSIEWIYEVYGAELNPLATDAGISEIRELSGQHHVSIRSICADYFMDLPLVRATSTEMRERVAKLQWLVERCSLLPVNRIVLPFVDASRIEGSEDRHRVVEILRATLPLAEKTKIELHLETSLPPLEFASLLDQIKHPLVKINYDSGNSASLGYRVSEEFQAYGERIGSVHIKDRVKGGGTVPLGTGDADFNGLFQNLEKINYSREFVLQVARDVAGGEVDWAAKNRLFVEKKSSGRFN